MDTKVFEGNALIVNIPYCSLEDAEDFDYSKSGEHDLMPN